MHLRARRSADKTGLAQEEARHHLHSPRSQKLFRQVLNTIGVLVHLEGDADALVLEHVKDSHYNCLVRKGAGSNTNVTLKHPPLDYGTPPLGPWTV